MTRENTSSRPACTAISIACLTSFVVSPASGAEQEGSSADIIQEILVTARHREERLQDVPDTVRAITAEQIEDAGINNVADAVKMVSNAAIFADQQPGVQTVTLRGVSQARGADSEPAFSFVVDGVTSPTIFSFTQDLYDIERMEVLKGPQGALYGRNAIGGAINVITRQPTNEFQVGAQASFAQGSETRFSGRVSGPIIEDKLLFRVSGSHMDYDGQLYNTTLGVRPDFMRESSVRAQLEIKPADSLNISLRGSYVDTDGGAVYNGVTNSGAFGATPGLIQEDYLGRGGRELTDFSAKIDWDLGAVALTSVTAYTDVQTYGMQDLDFTGVSVAEGHQFVKLHSWMQELRLSSRANQSVRWSLGGFFQRTSRDIQTLVFVNRNGPLGAVFGGPGGVGDPATKDMFNSADRTPMWDFDAWSLFGSADFDLSSRVTLTAGFRWDREEREFFQAGAAVSSGQRDFEEFQPKVSLSFRATDDALLYATYSTGFRPGGFNPFVGHSPDGTYDEETTVNYEVGLKSSWFDRRLTLNLAGFYSESEGTHQRLLNVALGQAEYFNIGDTEYRGAEIELFARPTDAFSLEAAFGITDSEITSINPAISNVGGLDPRDFMGNRVPRVNYNSASLGAQYEFPLGGDLKLVARGDYRRTGRGYWYLDNVDVQKPYETANFRLSLKAPKWTVTGYVENAFDEQWHVTFNNARFEGLLGGIDIFWPSPRRQAGIQVSYEFL